MPVDWFDAKFRWLGSSTDANYIAVDPIPMLFSALVLLIG